jgi:hypothetical protein
MRKLLLRIVIVVSVAATALLLYGEVAEAGLRINTN